MNNLQYYLPESNFLANVSTASKSQLFTLLVDCLARQGAIDSPAEALQAILDREELAPTGLGMECAIPHAHCATASRTCIAMATLASPLDFGAPDNLPARIVILMVGPPDSSGLHLKLLSKFARLLHDDNFRQQILKAADATILKDLVYERDH
jgi:mannitol/fructose-specific phosphotransferase system IIA component (Ntr-type)